MLSNVLPTYFIGLEQLFMQETGLERLPSCGVSSLKWALPGPVHNMPYVLHESGAPCAESLTQCFLLMAISFDLFVRFSYITCHWKALDE